MSQAILTLWGLLSGCLIVAVMVVKGMVWTTAKDYSGRLHV